MLVDDATGQGLAFEQVKKAVDELGVGMTKELALGEYLHRESISYPAALELRGRSECSCMLLTMQNGIRR